MLNLLDDPWVAARVEHALKPYRGRLSEEDLAWMRAELVDMIANEPRGAELLRQAHPRAVESSGDVVRSDVAAPTVVSINTATRKR